MVLKDMGTLMGTSLKGSLHPTSNRKGRHTHTHSMNHGSGVHRYCIVQENGNPFRAMPSIPSAITLRQAIYIYIYNPWTYMLTGLALLNSFKGCLQEYNLYLVIVTNQVRPSWPLFYWSPGVAEVMSLRGYVSSLSSLQLDAPPDIPPEELSQGQAGHRSRCMGEGWKKDGGIVGLIPVPLRTRTTGKAHRQCRRSQTSCMDPSEKPLAAPSHEWIPSAP